MKISIVGQRMMKTYNIGNDCHEGEQPETAETAELLGTIRWTEASNDSDRGESMCKYLVIQVTYICQGQPVTIFLLRMAD